MKKSLLITVLIFFGFFTFPQKKAIKFESFSVEDGLSQSSVLSIVQDSKGFMWFATLDGLNKYDGYNFKVYWEDENTEKSISDNIVNVLHTDKEGCLWAGTAANGICRYNDLKDNFDVYKHSDTGNSLSNNNINDISSIKGKLLIATDKGLNILDKKTGKFYYYNRKKSENSLCSDTVLSVCPYGDNKILVGTKNGMNIIQNQKILKNKILEGQIIKDICVFGNYIWIATENELYRFDADTKTNTKVSINSGTNEHPLINVIIPDKNDILWIGTENYGLIKLNTEDLSFYVYKHDPADIRSISTNSVISLYIDKSGILWAGTSLGGINKWNRAAEEISVFKHNPYNEKSLSAPQVRCFYADKDNDIWVGTVEGGLNKWDKEKNIFYHYKHNPSDKTSLSRNHVRSVLQDSKGRFWVATDGGGLDLFDKRKGTFKHYKKSKKPGSLPSDRVWKIFEDSEKRLWVGTFGGGLALFNPETGKFKVYEHSETDTTTISSNKVTSIFEDKNGNLWIGTFGGLNLFNPKTEKFIRFVKNNEKNSLSNDRIYCINTDKEGNLWIGTKGGLNKFDYKTGKFTVFNRINAGLPNNVILGITEDGDFLWFSTNNGICRMNKKTYEIKTYDVGDGLQSNEFLAGSYYKKDDGEILFGGIDGFNAFYPDKIKDNPHKPPVVITGFAVSNKNFDTDTLIGSKKLIVLNHTQKDISFEFVALDFIFPEKNRYKYKLEGYDENWTDAGYKRYAKYTNLKPGEYIFRVAGSNNDDVWNEKGASLKIIIEPAFWQTVWFRIGFVLFIFASVITVYKIRVRAIKKRNEELEAEVKRRTAEIRQQNEEIKAQRDEITIQRDQISEQKKEITDSILYAEKIQRAALPTNDYFYENLPEHFILFKPRDIVSGDFYWLSEKNGKIIVTAVDCTGHGVPGAFMSMLGISFLNKIVNEKNITDPAEILNRLRQNIINALHPKGYEIESKDGMDMALCVIDKNNETIEFSGAYNPLLYLQNGKITEIKADRMPVARYDVLDDFTKKEIKYRKGDIIYMFSDGYPDQFGGPKGKKFMKGKLKRLLESISGEPMEKQKEILEIKLKDWMGEQPQIDDIVIIGIKL